MAEEMIFQELIKREGYWSYSGLYTLCYNWLNDERYILLENVYKEDVTDGGSNLHVEWVATRPINDYMMYKIEVNFDTVAMNSAEIEVDGKKMKTNKGEMKVRVTGTLMKDYQGRWSQNSFFKSLLKIYEHSVIRVRLLEHEDLITEECLRFITEIKNFFEI